MGQRLAMALVFSAIFGVAVLAVVYYYLHPGGGGAAEEYSRLSMNASTDRIYSVDNESVVVEGELMIMNTGPEKITVYSVTIDYVTVRRGGFEKTFLGGNISVLISPEPPIYLLGKGSSRVIVYKINIPCHLTGSYTVEYKIRLVTNKGSYTLVVTGKKD